MPLKSSIYLVVSACDLIRKGKREEEERKSSAKERRRNGLYAETIPLDLLLS